MTSISAAMALPRPASLPLSPLDQLRQAALQSRRKKAQAAEAAVDAAPTPVAPTVVSNPSPVVGTTPSTSTTVLTPEPPRDLKRSNPDREEGEISDEDEAPPPAKAPKLEAPRFRIVPRPAPKGPGGRNALAEERPARVAHSTPILVDTPLSASSTMSASPMTPSFSSMQSHHSIHTMLETSSGEPWSTAEFEEVKNGLQRLMGAGVTPDGLMREGISRDFVQHVFPALNIPIPPSISDMTGISNTTDRTPAGSTPSSTTSYSQQIPIPIPFSSSDNPAQTVTPASGSHLNAFGVPTWHNSFTESAFSGIPGLAASTSTAPTQGNPTVQATTTEVERLRQREEAARRAALATKKLKAERAAAVAKLTAHSPVESTGGVATERPPSKSVPSTFLEDFDALLAEVDVQSLTVRLEDEKPTITPEDVKPGLDLEDRQPADVPSPAISNHTYDTDLADEQEIENAMFASEEDDDDMDMDMDDDQSFGEPSLPTPTAALPDEIPSPTGELRLAPPLTASVSESTSMSSTPGDVTPILPTEMPPVQRQNGRAAVADLDAQPLSRPEHAPVSRPHNAYRRSYHHHRHEDYRPLVIDISDSDDDGADDDEQAPSRSLETAISFGPLGSSSTVQAELAAAHAEADASRIAAQRRLAEIEAEQAKYARIMARLEEKARKEASAKSAATSGQSTPLSFGSGAASPAVRSLPANRTLSRSAGPSEDTTERDQQDSVDKDVKMMDAPSTPEHDSLHNNPLEGGGAPTEFEADHLKVGVDAPLKGVLNTLLTGW
ncbi:hypothetical protein CALVIDRAFT_94697 [Calocera viscosa TUFC12733]|uniref:Uncharacterized protein n=1 Tax=Calocera viscosa (strain TUFC12733) TaxID=1330018 RepID=A0A167MXK8_CALVF|nr:hypothetical protein CALVIDRAFT_94697 [Calocera viscosa TUFC12733]